MGLTCHMALAFDPADEAKIIALFIGESEDGDDRIRYQPDFDLTREDHWEVHRILEVWAENNPELAALGTIVIGSRLIAEAGMGTQYFYTAEAVRRMADAYRQVTPDTLAAAIEKVRPEFDGRFFVPAYLAEKFAVVRRELAVVADKGWAMIAGMI